jgi:chromosome segregation ATPase
MIDRDNWADPGFDQSNLADLSKEVSHYLSSLSTSASNKLSLIKMQVLKCDEYNNNYKRMRICFNHGDIDEADRILANLEESNHQSLLDLQNEIADGPSMVSTIGHLCEQIKREKLDFSQTQRGRSPGGYSAKRSASNSRAPAAADYSKYDQKISDLKLQLASMEEENDKLRGTMREMVDDYTKQLELRDDTIKRMELNQRQDFSKSQQMSQIRQETDLLKQENHTLRSKVNQLNRDLVEKERQLERSSTEQKSEWAEIYGSQKQNAEKLERDNMMLQQEIASLKRQMEQNAPKFGTGPGGPSAQEFSETTKRLKKRELECQALWDTIKDMKKTGQNTFEMN